METKVLFIGGVFAKENIPEVVKKAKGTIEYSANIFQERLISGFEKLGVQLEIISAPFIGAYPMKSKTVIFKGFENLQNKYKYVSFVNVWGYRNFSRAHSLKKNVKAFAEDRKCEKKIIIVYSAHEPFLEAASYAKKIDPNIKICFVVPDLPQYMNLDKNRSIVYDVLKKVDIARMEKHINNVDSFVVLTEYMKEILKVGERPTIVAEGIIDNIQKVEKSSCENRCKEKYVVYTGKLNEKFGVKKLVNNFTEINNPNYRLILCGDGDCVPFIRTIAKKDKRVVWTGQLTPEQAKEWQNRADVLINPRMNDEEYTKYSFPSKNIEYLLTGNPVVAYMLDGMKACYKDFIYVIDDGERIEKTIQEAITDSEESKRKKYDGFLRYAKSLLSAESIAREIIELND